jgi:hypothetical protein
VTEGEKRLLVAVAGDERPELIQLGCGDGRHGFAIKLDDKVWCEGKHILTLRCADTGAEMPGSPIIFEHRGNDLTPPATALRNFVSNQKRPAFRSCIDEVSERGIVGWVMIPNRPSYRCVVALKEYGRILARTVASQFRSDLLSAGIGDGCYCFTFELPSSLLDGEEHNIEIIEEETSLSLADQPVQWKSGLGSAAFRSILNKLSSGVRTRYTITRSDLARHRSMQRFVTANAAASVLSVTDCLRSTCTLPSKFFTDCMVSAWLSREDLRRRFPQLEMEVCQYAFLVWYLCIRPLEDGLILSCEPTGPILIAMSATIVGEPYGSTAGPTALMLAAYHYVTSYSDGKLPGPAQDQTNDITAWFFCDGAYRLRVSHAISQGLRADLAVPQSDGTSQVLKWAIDRIPADNTTNGATEYGPNAILDWLDDRDRDAEATSWRDLLRESLIVNGGASFDGDPNPIVPAVCGRIRDVVQDMTQFLLIDGWPEYMCIGGGGERLLLKGEWYPVEPAFVWSRAPISTLLFCVAGGALEWLRLGLIFDQAPKHERRMRIILNHNSLWSGTIGDASSGELILACSGRCIAQGAPNLLQIEVDEAFVPAEQSQSSDHRRLGVGLKRVWIQRAEGLAS